MKRINKKGLVLVGCGRMGSALLDAWLNAGLKVGSVYVVDPQPSEWLLEKAAAGINLNADLPADPAIVVLATKPQMMHNALSAVPADRGSDTVFLSVAAGIPIAAFETVLGSDARIVRSMPNLPAMIGQGMTALTGNDAAGKTGTEMAIRLMSLVGQVVEVKREDDLHSVTALSGSGPGYVFAFIEAFAKAGGKMGLDPDTAFQLSRQTVLGAAMMAKNDLASLAKLRDNVSSPAGTTLAGLAVLMREQGGLDQLLLETMQAARTRSIELAELG
ncbi:MAG: pyrroline-5-carboxylate reductase [Paracoccaceae bacterium]